MSYMQAFKSAILKIDQLQAVQKIKFGQAIAHLLLLSAILAIPLTSQMVQIFASMRQDGQKIAENIPDFTIEAGTLNVNKGQEGFIYQTDSIIFTFDPEGKRTAKEIGQDLLGNFLSVGLLKNQAVITFPATESVTSLLGSNQMSIPYDTPQMTELTGQKLRQIILEKQLPWWIFPLTFFVAIYPAFLSLIFTVILATLFCKSRGTFSWLESKLLK
ncbi:DUF1189 family protein [Enterococcus sp. LJL98]